MKTKPKNDQPTQLYPFLGDFKQRIWLLGISFWVLGMVDRSIAAFSDGYLSTLDLTQLLTASFFFVSWLFLKPTRKLEPSESNE
jgi:urea transporter